MIRSASHEGLPVVVEICNESGVTTTASYDVKPATLEERTTWSERLQNRGHPVLVLKEGGRMVGFAGYGLSRDKATYYHTIKHSVYVTGEGRSGGASRVLLGALLNHARGRGVHVMIGVLGVDNAASRAFHKNPGFIESAVLPRVDRRFGRWLDTVFITHCFD